MIGVTLRPEVDRKAVKLSLRIQQLMNQSNGRIVNIQIVDGPDGEYWLYVNGGKREVIE
jgi:Mrp family chromosome partitioning ATPase